MLNLEIVETRRDMYDLEKVEGKWAENVRNMGSTGSSQEQSGTQCHINTLSY